MYKLIKLENNFILVSDEKIKDGDKFYTKCFDNIFTATNFPLTGTDAQKIIAGIPEILSIDSSLLSEEDCKTIGFIDAEKLAKEYCRNENDETIKLISKYSFKDGFKTAQSLNDKCFSLEDIKNAISFGINTQHILLTPKGIEVESDNFIQSLQQTSWDCICELSENKKSYIITKIL